MHHSQALSLIDQMFTTATRIGGKVPKTLTDQRDSLAALSGKVRAFDIGADLPNTVLASLEAGHDPATDPDVQTAATRSILGQSSYGIAAALDQRLTQYLIDNTDALLALFDKPFAAAAATLAAARERLGDVDLSDTAAVIARGGDAASVWAGARAADDAIHQIQQAWKILGNVSTGAKVQPRYRLLIIAEVPPAEFQSQDFVDAAVTRAWGAARRGYPLVHATPETLSERVAAAQGEVRRLEVQSAADSQAAIQRRYGHKAAVA
jgi:hypothetical protein